MDKVEFSQATIEQAINAIKKHEEEFKAIQNEGSNKTLEEVAQMMIIEKFGDAQIEAEEIVNDLKGGLIDFDTQFRNNVETEKINVIERLTKSTENMSDEERTNCYVNILTAIQLLGNKEISQDEIEVKQAENTKLSTEELLAKIEDQMNNVISLDLLTASVQKELNPEVLSMFAKQLEMNKDDYRFMAAFWLYIEQREGNIKLSDTEFALPATELGALAGAAIEAIIVTNELNEGKIDMKTWQKVMKWILGALIGTALGLLALSLVASAGLLALALVWSLFGTGAIAFFFSMAVLIYVSWEISDHMAGVWVSMLQTFSNFYNKNIAAVTEKIASWIAIIKGWVTNAVDKVKTTVSTKEKPQTVENPEISTVETNNNEENTQGLQPVMA